MTVKSCEKVEKSQVELTIEVNAAEFEAAVEKAYQKMRRNSPWTAPAGFYVVLLMVNPINPTRGQGRECPLLSVYRIAFLPQCGHGSVPGST